MAFGDTISLEFLARQQVVLLDEMKNFRDEMTEMRREMRMIRQSFIGISEHFSRQERRVSELRDDVQTMIRMEVGGSIANLETRMEVYIDGLDQKVSGLDTKLDAILSAVRLA